MGHPAHDPHGNSIPDHSLVLADSRALSLLASLQPGQQGVVRHVSNQAPAVLIYLQSIGICPGAELVVKQVNPIDGTQRVFLPQTQQTPVLGKPIRDYVQVEVRSG
jgi:DtxR family Mn-dependent transcriptional regulator